MPPRSAARPMIPSSASISRTRWPLPNPPIAGLQDISPIVSIRWVRSRVRAPRRADAAAASQPAWPPPTTITSYEKARMPGHLRLRSAPVQMVEMAGVVDEPHPHIACREDLDLVQRTRLLGQLPVGRQRLVEQLQQQRAVDAVVPDQDD